MQILPREAVFITIRRVWLCFLLLLLRLLKVLSLFVRSVSSSSSNSAFLETGDVAHQRQTASDGEERAPKGEYSQHASVSRVQAELHPGFHLLCDVGDHDGALFWGFASEDL